MVDVGAAPTPGRRTPDDEPALTAKQRLLHDRLNRITGPHAAAFFRDACRIAARPDAFDAPVNLIYHCMREVQSSIMHVLVPAAEHAGIKISPPKKPTEDDEEAEYVELGRVHISAVSEYLRLDPEKATVWKQEAAKLHKLAHRAGLGRPRPWPTNRATFDRLVDIYDSVLPLIEDNFHEILRGVDSLLEKLTPSKKNAGILHNHAPNSIPVLFKVFEKIATPEWFRSFRAAHAFENPPPTIHEDGTTRFPPWPALRLAELVAEKIPQEVADVLKEIADVDNPAVTEHLLKVALLLPTENIAQLKDTITTWLDVDTDYPFGSTLGKIINKLVDGQETEAAANLLEFCLQLDPNTASDDLGTLAYSHPSTASRLHAWQWGEFVRKQLPPLWKSDAKLAFEVTADTLDDYVHAYDKARQAQRLRDRASASWIPDLLQKPDDRVESPLRLMAATLTRETLAAVTEGRLTPAEALELADRPGDVYPRLRMVLLARNKNADPAEVTRALEEFEEAEEAGQAAEFWELAAAHWTKADASLRQEILQWIDEAEEISEWARKSRDPRIDAKRYVDRWRFERLHPIRNHLDESRRRQYDEFSRTMEARGFRPDVGPATVSAVDSVSPFTLDELQKLGINELIDQLKTWTPNAARFDASPAGLGNLLEKVVVQRPEEVSKHAKEFIGLRGAYVDAVLDGLARVAPTRPIDWGPSLDLAAAAAKEGGKPWDWNDPPASPRSALRLLEAGLRIHDNSVPLAMREKVWGVVAAAGKSPPPPPPKDGPGRSDSYFEGINSDRGRAVEASISYADWIRRNTKDFKLSKHAPEVAQFLHDELHEATPSDAVLSVFGVFAVFLHFWDSEWFNAHRTKIFPNDGSQRHDAAWGGYIEYAKFFNDSYTRLQPEYDGAVKRLTLQGPDAGLNKNDKHLIEHLLLFYRLGVLNLKPESPLWKILHEGPTEARLHATQHMAHHAPRAEEKLAEGEAQRFLEYWKERRSTLENHLQNPIAQAELKLFGWWVRFAPIPTEFMLDEVIWLLSHNVELAEPFMWIEKLVGLDDQQAKKIADVLLLLLKQARSAADVYPYQDDLYPLLVKLLKNEAAKAIARQVANRLLAFGFHDFRSLLA